MRKIILPFAAILAVSILVLSGCNKESQILAEVDHTEIVGSLDFFSSMEYLNAIHTKAGEVSDDELNEQIQPLLVSSKEYLTLNGYNYLEDFDENDPRIILTAFALLEIDLAESIPTTKLTLTDALSCVFLGDAVGNLVNTGAMLLAKRIASKVISNAVPGIGIAVGVISAGKCIYDNWGDGVIVETPNLNQKVAPCDYNNI